SSRSSSASRNICHHAPLGIASFGAAVCHGPSPFHASGTCAVGRLYPGPTVQPTVQPASNAAASKALFKSHLMTEGNRFTSAHLLRSAWLRALAALHRESRTG